MRNLKFGVFCLGLIVAVATAVSSLSAQADGRPSIRIRPAMPTGFSLRASGSQLGVMVSDLDSKAASGGVKIDEVIDGSPAEKAGIKAGDVVVEYDGERVRSARQFTRLIQETPEGRTVAIGLLRDGQKQAVNATPEAGNRDQGTGIREPGDRAFSFRAMPEFNFDYDDRMPRRFEYRLPEGFRLPTPGSRFPSSRGRLGVSVQSITPELADYFGAKNGGALVSSVTKDSAAAKAGIKAGDVIVSVNGRGVRDSDDLVSTLQDLNGDVTIVVLRDKKEMTLKATIQAVGQSGGQAVRPSRPGL